MTYIVFGATGDLAKKKLYPAFAALLSDGFIDPRSKFIGYGRSKMTAGVFILAK